MPAPDSPEAQLYWPTEWLPRSGDWTAKEGSAVRLVIRGFFVASAVMLALLGLAVPTLEAGSDSFVILVLRFVMLVVMFLGSAACIYVGWDPFEELLERVCWSTTSCQRHRSLLGSVPTKITTDRHCFTAVR